MRAVRVSPTTPRAGSRTVRRAAPAGPLRRPTSATRSPGCCGRRRRLPRHPGAGEGAGAGHRRGGARRRVGPHPGAHAGGRADAHRSRRVRARRPGRRRQLRTQQRREAEEEARGILADAEEQARAAREASEAMASQAQDEARARYERLREEIRSLEDRRTGSCTTSASWRPRSTTSFPSSIRPGARPACSTRSRSSGALTPVGDELRSLLRGFPSGVAVLTVDAGGERSAHRRHDALALARAAARGRLGEPPGSHARAAPRRGRVRAQPAGRRPGGGRAALRARRPAARALARHRPARGDDRRAAPRRGARLDGGPRRRRARDRRPHAVRRRRGRPSSAGARARALVHVGQGYAAL